MLHKCSTRCSQKCRLCRHARDVVLHISHDAWVEEEKEDIPMRQLDEQEVHNFIALFLRLPSAPERMPTPSYSSLMCTSSLGSALVTTPAGDNCAAGTALLCACVSATWTGTSFYPCLSIPRRIHALDNNSSAQVALPCVTPTLNVSQRKRYREKPL